MRTKYFVKPVGAGHYDKRQFNGLPFDVEQWAKSNGGVNLKWEHIWGYRNCPKVLTFEVHQTNADSGPQFDLFDALPTGAKYSAIVAWHWDNR